MARLAGKKFLITGASGYMGSDFARAFAREGADLVLTSRTLSKLETLADELRRDFGREIKCCAADICNRDDAKKLAEFTCCSLQLPFTTRRCNASRRLPSNWLLAIRSMRAPSSARS